MTKPKRLPSGTRPRHDDCRAPAPWQGTPNGYGGWGCRCPKCREAWNIRRRERRGQRERLPYGSRPRHDKCIAPEQYKGTFTGYGYYTCRCPRCRAAWMAYQRAYRERKQAREKTS